MDGTNYNGNPTSAINQYNANRQFSRKIDRFVDGIDMAEKVAPKAQKQLDFAKDVLTAMKSDADAAIIISKALITIAEENPIGKAVFSIYKEPIKAVFNLLLVNQRINNINSVLDVLRDYMINARSARNSLLRYDRGKYSDGPWTFLAKKIAENRGRGLDLDESRARTILADLNVMGTQLVAAHDVLLWELAPAVISVQKFVDFCKKDIYSEENKSMIDKLGDGALSQAITGFELQMNEAGFAGSDNDVLGNRNNWARWCGMLWKDKSEYL
jgi:hypothetical protein